MVSSVELAHGEKFRTDSTSLFDAPGTKASASEQIIRIQQLEASTDLLGRLELLKYVYRSSMSMHVSSSSL